MPLAFENFIDRLAERLKQPLPGPRAHEPLRATPLGAIKPVFQHKLPPKPGSVLILLYPEGDTVKFPLTKRPEYIGAHSGQISLPGGKAEEGETSVQTALREGQEEIGVLPSNIEVVGQLSEFFVIPSNFLVTPIVAYQKSKPLLVPDPVEVVKIIEGELGSLLKPDAVKTREILAARTYPMMAPHFLIEDEIVWGATAMMLNEMREVVRDVWS
ncbi:MAG: CoA pyrophosphatase [Cyclobacteriaceae bacterium]|nr:CoA pyrophosphatase [Cyclobacteriaceae bacterium]